jgi:hypothetical protein
VTDTGDDQARRWAALTDGLNSDDARAFLAEWRELVNDGMANEMSTIGTVISDMLSEDDEYEPAVRARDAARAQLHLLLDAYQRAAFDRWFALVTRSITVMVDHRGARAYHIGYTDAVCRVLGLYGVSADVITAVVDAL